MKRRHQRKTIKSISSVLGSRRLSSIELKFKSERETDRHKESKIKQLI